jgi:hypothetical protein
VHSQPASIVNRRRHRSSWATPSLPRRPAVPTPTVPAPDPEDSEVEAEAEKTKATRACAPRRHHREVHTASPPVPSRPRPPSPPQSQKRSGPWRAYATRTSRLIFLPIPRVHRAARRRWPIDVTRPPGCGRERARTPVRRPTDHAVRLGPRRGGPLGDGRRA